MARWMGNPDGTPKEESARKAIVEEAKKNLPRLAASYVSTLQMPIPWLPFFDIVDKYGPEEKQKGYRSLFDLLREKKMKWLECSWPLSCLLPRHDDAAITAHVIHQLEAKHSFAFVHLMDLDGLGHAFGPESTEVQKGIQNADELTECLVERCKELDPNCEIIIFGDHGMLTVVRTMDLWTELNQLPFRFGEDYVYFLDSTMARFWFLNQQARAPIEKWLASVPLGKILNEEDKKQFSIDGCDPRNGELIFLVEPHIVIHPNFFQRAGSAPRGMHGYDPRVKDNEGVLICHGPKTKSHAFLGAVDAVQLYPLILDRLGFSPAEHTPVALPVAQSIKSRFTKSSLPEADAVIKQNLDLICNAILEFDPLIEGIILTGGFGRGEGAMQLTENGVKAVNDYDILVAAPHYRSGKELGRKLAEKIGIDYVDISYFNPRQNVLKSSQIDYDTRYGSQILYGDPRLLNHLPDLASGNISIEDGYKIIFNRLAGIMTTRFEVIDHNLVPENPHYLQNQINKVLMALGDAYLINCKAYDSSYEVRAERFRFLSHALGLSKELTETISDAYQRKLNPDYKNATDTLGLFYQANRLIKVGLNAFFGNDFSHRWDKIAYQLSYFNLGIEQQKRDLEKVFQIKGLIGYKPKPETQINLRASIYSVLSHLFFALDGNGGIVDSELRLASNIWEQHFINTNSECSGLEQWNRLRKNSVLLWEEICH